MAHNLQDATEQLKCSSYQVVLIDMQLPDGDGSDLFRLVRSANPRARTVLVTGYRSEMNDLIAQALAEGADAVQYKPFHVPDLIETMGNLAKARDECSEFRP
jgi:CheY-like chemotaxis protein